MTSQRTVTLRAFLLAIVGLTAVFALVVVAIVRIDQRNQRERDVEALDINYLNCLRGNEFRTLVRDKIVVPAFAGSGALDLTQVDGFSAMPESVQQVFENIAALNAGRVSPEGQIVADINKQIRDCEHEWAGHTPGIRLPHNDAAQEATT